MMTSSALAQDVGVFLEMRIQFRAGHPGNAGTGGADHAGIERFQTIDAAQHRAFTASRRADDRNQIALLDGKAHAFENGRLIEALVEVLNRNERGRGVHWWRCPMTHVGGIQGMKCDQFVSIGNGFHSRNTAFPFPAALL